MKAYPSMPTPTVGACPAEVWSAMDVKPVLLVLMRPPGSGKREGDVAAAGWVLGLASARGDDHELPPPDLVGRGGGVARGGQRRLPQQAAGRLVEGVELLVVARGADEHEASRGHHGTAIVLAARPRHPL